MTDRTEMDGNMLLTVTGLAKTYPGGDSTVGVQDISFAVPTGAMFTLLGPSGCGKTTTVRCVAGLEHPDGGEISIGGTTVFSRERRVVLPPNRRDIGMVFQSYAVWPHMTVAENVAFPLHNRSPKPSGNEIRKRVDAVLELVGLAGCGNRPATRLSGGQQQRVALARALVARPRLLLLDEPLSNLDAKLRENLRDELRVLHQTTGTTMLYVTHDQSEALAMSDRLAVINRGRIEQAGTPAEIYNWPHSRFVAHFVGRTNFVDGRVKDCDPGSREGVVETAHGCLRCRCAADVARGSPVVVCIRPEHIRVTAERPEGTDNVLEGYIQSVTFLGEKIDCSAQVGSDVFQCAVSATAEMRVGDRAFLQMETNRCLALR